MQESEAGAAEGLDQERSHCVKQSFWSESFSRVLEVEFDDGDRAVVPRANVEMIEE
mgnify:CR=1 FL=1